MPGSAPWLAMARTTLAFRTIRWARLAGLQAARSGYPAVLTESAVTLEAPLLVVFAIMATVGLGSDVVGVPGTDLDPSGGHIGVMAEPREPGPSCSRPRF